MTSLGGGGAPKLPLGSGRKATVSPREAGSPSLWRTQAATRSQYAAVWVAAHGEREPADSPMPGATQLATSAIANASVASGFRRRARRQRASVSCLKAEPP